MLASTVKQLALGWLICSTLISATVMASGLGDGREQSINIPAGDLTASLELLAKQTGAEFVYDADQLKGITTRGVSGNLTPKAAVLKLLEGTHLTLTEHKSGAILIAAPQGSVHRVSTLTPMAANESVSSTHLAQ
jgi:iron complex outermembrane receptor protein